MLWVFNTWVFYKTYLDVDCRKCIIKQKYTISFYSSLKWYWVCKSILLNHLIWHWNKIWEVLCNPLVFSIAEYIIGTLKIRNNSWCPTFLFWPLFSYHSTNFAIAKVVALISAYFFCTGFLHWFIPSFQYCFLYCSSNYCDSIGTLFAIASKSDNYCYRDTWKIDNFRKSNHEKMVWTNAMYKTRTKN